MPRHLRARSSSARALGLFSLESLEGRTLLSTATTRIVPNLANFHPVAEVARVVPIAHAVAPSAATTHPFRFPTIAPHAHVAPAMHRHAATARSFGMGGTASPSASTAAFIGTNTTAQGNWSTAFGGDGYALPIGASSLPAYATVSYTIASTGTSAASTTDVRALQTGPAAATRAANHWVSPYLGTAKIDINLTDGKSHQVSVYALDWERWGRSERIDVVDATTGAVLDTRSLPSFGNGQYLSWNLTGHVQIQFTGLNTRAILDGLFFGTAVGTTPTPTPTPPPVVGPPVSGPYNPTQIRHAYGIDSLAQNGAGQTIAIIDAYDDPTIAGDLAAFNARFGLPTSGFTKAIPQGTPTYDAGWAGEIALDVEWAHAIAPAANILLVEAKSAQFSDLLAAVDYAVAHGANQVSMSFGGGDFSGETYYDSHFNHPGVSFFASAGDSGAGVEYPAASPYVTAVGGTLVSLDAAGNRVSEVAWTGSGGGATANESKPSYQNGIFNGAGRGVPDVSYNADPNSGVLVYNSSGGGSWYQVGGTSAGAPQWAGIAALINQGRAAAGKATIGTGTTFGLNQILYTLPGADYYDVTAGSNGNPATAGYDLVTGLGSPVASKLVPDLIRA